MRTRRKALAAVVDHVAGLGDTIRWAVVHSDPADLDEFLALRSVRRRGTPHRPPGTGRGDPCRTGCRRRGLPPRLTGTVASVTDRADTDAALIERYLRGEMAAFEELMRP